jgi:hypothetical protein
MGEFTTTQFLAYLTIAGGAIAGVIKIFTFISHQLDARRKRIEAREQKKLDASVEARRLTLDYSEKGERNTITELWKLVDDKDEEIKDLEAKLKEAEKAERLNRPTIMKIYGYVRDIRNEMDSLNIMLLSEEETNVFARRWGNIKVIIQNLEAVLSGDQ